MPRAKQNRRSARREREEIPTSVRIPPVAVWLMRELLPLVRRRRKAASRSAKHLRNAGVEVLEAMRALLDETIEWLREEERSPEMRRIRVED